MPIFEPIELEWEGVPYKISGDDRIMKVLASVEEHITFVELQEGQATGNIPVAKLSMAYTAVLQHAGCRATASEVYRGMWSDGRTTERIRDAVLGLLQMMIPPDIMESLQNDPEATDGEDAPEKKT